MEYNFDEISDRTLSDSLKWSKKYLEESFGDESCLPLWIADMDFKTPKPVIDALTERVAHGIFGYGYPPEEFKQCVVDWQKRRNGWYIEKEWLVFSTGILPALNFIIQSFCLPGDRIVLQTPVYYPFREIIESNGCFAADNPLILKDEKYEMNFDQLEQLVQHSRVKMLILCSPHNPVGRVWKEEELKRLGKICLANDVLVVSDEIHSDLIYTGHKHIPFASISETFAQNSIICTAPTKTFNLAGIQTSNLIIKNKRIREILGDKLTSAYIEPSVFAIAAQIAAYTKGEDWLAQLLQYLQANVTFTENFLLQHMPEVRLIQPEATFLAWLDFRQVFKDAPLLEEWMKKKAKVALDEGYIFGQGGEGFARINFACPRSTLENALLQIARALKNV